ncbi:ATP-dependent DNA helicase chl1 [Coemansia sp. RSA 552]|nr:ATP-dependent DNA helicase chl1 [Coemansia sp. RSA 552]
MTGAQELATPQTAEEFSFPMTPYPIQLEFMQRLFETCERGGLGVFESPTGTGKSLSIICGALTWLRHNQRRTPQPKVDAVADMPDWVQAYEQKRVAEEEDTAEAQAERYAAWVARVRQREAAEARVQRQKSRQMGAATTKPRAKREREAEPDSDDALVDEYASDRSMGSEDSDDSGDPEEPNQCKVVYASRTHSQLQQFVREVRRTRFAQGPGRIKCVALGSRAQLCVNPEVRRGDVSVHLLNERCTELRQRRNMRCGFLPKQRTPMFDFGHGIGEKIMDIEELATAGKERGVCAYYGARASVNSAHVVAMPYNMLLSQGARTAMGVDLRGCVVVVDEAHNLVDTVLATHTAELRGGVVGELLEMLRMYWGRYWQRLGPGNSVHVRQAIALLRALDKFCTRARPKGVSVLAVDEFLAQARADHINVFKIDRYLKQSHLGRKLNMFADRQPAANGREQRRFNAPATAVAALEAFIECMGRPSRNGARIVVRSDGAGAVDLKYLLLDPSEPFGQLLSEARAVILAGGTMKPAEHMIQQLVPGGKAHQYAWGHVVPSAHIRAVVVESGPTGMPLRLALRDQADAGRLRECGQALAALCNVIPAGVVCFFPSHALLARMLAAWEQCGVAERISRRKRIFAESSGDVLRPYSEHIRTHGGALLLSVVGGRLSEGINFSDDLGRAVVMIGLPFPSLGDPELVERLAHFESPGSRPSSDFQMGPRARSLYETMCMRAVNQSIGRAIRHQRDYAAVVFLDPRYGEARIASKLPAWIAGDGGQAVRSCKFGPALGQIASFFKQDFTG